MLCIDCQQGPTWGVTSSGNAQVIVVAKSIVDIIRPPWLVVADETIDVFI